MAERTTFDGGRSSLGRLVLIALAFLLGYAVGNRSTGASDEWREPPTEPTQITIEDEETSEDSGDAEEE